MDLTYFNPLSQKESDFLAGFVARQDVLQFFVRQLELLAPSEQARHHLIVAPRGFGKTSLLRRIAIAVRTDPALFSRYLPLNFREEQHNVISLDVFWRNCLQALMEAREHEGAPAAEIDAIDAAWTRLAPRHEIRREDQDGGPAWEEFRRRCDDLGRRPILLIDNLDTLLAGLSADHQWGLRRCLQASDGPVLLSAASRYPECTQDHSAAFYEFFRIQTLDRLSDLEVTKCLRTLAEHRGESGKSVLELLENHPGRIGALNTMAGGNPRTLGVLYGVLESHMSSDVLSQLSAMLDTFTGWYQARTEELPMQARAVFDALALHWDPITAAALGTITGLDTPTVSSQLSRLEKLGFVEAVSLSRSGKGRSGYQVAERFFNIWYLMRNGPRRTRHSIRFLTLFLQACFNASERHSMGRTALAADGTDPGYAVALATCVDDLSLQTQLLEHAAFSARKLTEAGEYGALIQEFQSRSGRISSNPPGIADPMEASAMREEEGASEAATLLHESAELASKRDFGGAVARLDQLIHRFGDSLEAALRHQVAWALFNKGVILGELGRPEAEIESYDSLIRRFGDGSEAALHEQVARAYFNKGVVLGQLGRPEAALESYDSLINLFGDALKATLLEVVARAYFNKGVVLRQYGLPEAAIKSHDSLIHRFGDSPEAALREQVAMALVNKGFALGELGRPEAEIECYDSVIHRFGDALEAVLREGVARALVNKGSALSQLSRPEAAIECYDSVIQRFGDAPEATLRAQVAKAFAERAQIGLKAGRMEAAVSDYRSALERAPSRGNLYVDLGNILLDHQGEPEAALEVYGKGLAICTDAHTLAFLHANCAYVSALHLHDRSLARQHAQKALQAPDTLFSTAGRKLLEALPVWNDDMSVDWKTVFRGIDQAIQSEDPHLWTAFLTDMQRLLWFAIISGAGDQLRQWMDAADYSLSQAPLYHAVLAALDGEDHLLQINPEVRAPAQRIYEGIGRRLAIYGRNKPANRSKKSRS
jgi:tetratricopeptide (TPR) repeat protein/DNA-binding transcriptional ArsR family regulator